MSSPQDAQDQPSGPRHQDDSDPASSTGPNLVLIYSLIAFALVAAIAIAVLIVMPFYLRR